MNTMHFQPPASYRIPLMVAILLLGAINLSAQATLQSPDSFFGHSMGADRKLVSYDEALPYLHHLARHSRYVEIHNAGITLDNRDLVYLLISSPANLSQKERLRELSAQFHYPQGSTPLELEHTLDEGKTILMITANMHSDEIISSQMVLEWAYRLASQQYPKAKAYLDDVVVILFPSLNPDGQVLITEWYREHAGTEFEGASLPWLYHRYAGHSINRDWFMLNLPETRAVNRVFQEWFPQVVVDVHQMGLTGPRLFVPPYADPVSDHVHPLIHRGAALFGANMSLQLEQAGKQGVIDRYHFDAYWPGGLRTTPWWKNTVGILVEAASCRIASPVFVEPEDLEGGHKGLVDYQPQVNFPNPWPGGWWRPRDILEYEMIAVDSALETAALRRRDLLVNRVIMSQTAMYAPSDGVFAYVIPKEEQEDPGSAQRLVDLLLENGVDVFVTEENEQQGDVFIPKGSVFIPTAQPLRPFLREMMEPQTYREIRPGLGSRDILRPYDVTAWTLPVMMGVTVWTLDSPLETRIFRSRQVEWNRSRPDTLTGDQWWSLSPKENDSFTAVWRFMAADLPVYQNPAADSTQGLERVPGSFWVHTDRETLERSLRGLVLNRVQPAEHVDTTHWRLLQIPRVGVYLPWNPTSDSGWLSYVLDSFEIPYTSLNHLAVDGQLSLLYDVILLPDMGVDELLEGPPVGSGRQKVPLPTPYNGGLGLKGVEALQRFVQAGGTLATLGESSYLALAKFNLPLHTLPVNAEQPDTPGVLLETFFDPLNPLAYGMPQRGTVFHTQSPVFVTDGARPGNSYSVGAWFPHVPRAVSGWSNHLTSLANKAALVNTHLGKGSVVLFGFRPHFRGQVTSTFKLLFNTLLQASVVTSSTR